MKAVAWRVYHMTVIGNLLNEIYEKHRFKAIGSFSLSWIKIPDQLIDQFLVSIFQIENFNVLVKSKSFFNEKIKVLHHSRKFA